MNGKQRTSETSFNPKGFDIRGPYAKLQIARSCAIGLILGLDLNYCCHCICSCLQDLRSVRMDATCDLRV